MAIPPVVAYPDPRLRLPAAAVTDFGDDLAADVDRLRHALREIPARGLAGPHLGIMRRVVAIDLAPQGRPDPHVFVNPRVIDASAETAGFEEGSVSMPGLHERVERPARVTVAWQDLAGAPHEGTFEGFMAACVQHEIDQCDGIFWLDRLTRLRRERLLARLDKLTRQKLRAAAGS